MKNSDFSAAITFNEYKDSKTEIYYFGNDYGLFIDIDNKNMSRKIYIYKNKNIKTDLFTIVENDVENQSEIHNPEYDDPKDNTPYSGSVKMIIVAAVIFTSVVYLAFYIIVV